MKRIFYTQRVEMVEEYCERRDCADQRIPIFLQECGYLPFPIPNVIVHLDNFLDEAMPDGILLTGGNSLRDYGGDAPERDKTEEDVLRWAIGKKIPVYGICRGMQLILNYFGCKLVQVQNHVGMHHRVNGKWGNLCVNSFHNQAVLQTSDEFDITAISVDGVIEAVGHKEYPIMASMWHPERESPFAKEDIQRIKELFH